MTVKDNDFRPKYLISIHMPHTWHDYIRNELDRLPFISIHMPHTWHDYLPKWRINGHMDYFNPHATYVA